MALQGRYAHLRAAALLVLHPFSDRPHSDGAVAGLAGVAGSTPGLIFVHVVYGVGFTTLYYRNYYASFPTELVRAAQIDGAGFFRIFWRILLPSSGPITAVSVIWQFTAIWNDFLFGPPSPIKTASRWTVALNNLVSSSTGVKEYNVHFAGGDHGRGADALGLHSRRALFRARPHGRVGQGLTRERRLGQAGRNDGESFESGRLGQAGRNDGESFESGTRGNGHERLRRTMTDPLPSHIPSRQVLRRAGCAP